MGAGASTPSAPPPESKCPVDHKTREIWLQQHKNSAGGESHPPTESAQTKLRPLSNEREVSSIPRAFDKNAQPATTDRSPAPSPYSTNASHATPSNSETETGHDPVTGNWIYPSERQFFDALVRKNNIPASASSAKELATSVASIIPIHNAVNEKAWQEILQWESRAPASDPGSKKCGGPKLYSFRGIGTDSWALSPRARINGWLGYQLPFDRHDWVVERCDGQRIEYVIDFYEGRRVSSGSSKSGLVGTAEQGKLSFYLDVRPKLNSFEGWRMRFNRFWGL
ncbi:hypothetical protein VTN49DRAFT_3066 [Thermomyces lanuginosus]|uniref:uncharacterized protein n=1 Tax=Thermomyces lanuginosus TaxID=5541 RepID=UPI003742FCCE